MDAISGCARCRAPMRLLDSSALGQSQFDMLSFVAADVQSAHGHSNAKQQHHQQQQHGISRLPPSLQSAYAHNPARLQQPQIHKSNYKHGDKSPASSFIVLSQSQTSDSSSSSSTAATVSPSAAEAKVTRSAALYHLLNTSSAIDHPLCIECADALQESMNAQLESVKAERQRYLAFDKELQANEKLDQQSPEELEAQLQKLGKEEAEAMDQLRQAEREQEELESQMRALDVEERDLQAQEERFWEDHAMHVLEQKEAQSQAASIKTQLDHDLRALDKLQKANVYNDAFCIGHDGGLATINGLRLGRLPNVPVEWSEINAAWGHALLLLSTIARKWDYTFERWRLIPKASLSKIERLSDNTQLELYASGDWFGLHRRFNAAQVGFLDCLDQLMHEAKARSAKEGGGGGGGDEVRFHHDVHKDKIGNVSIRLGFSSGTDETWTRALRHVLLSLKILLSRIDE